MAGLTTLYESKRKNEDPRGRKRRKGWRVTMNTPGRKTTSLFLSVKKYKKEDAEQCRVIVMKIESAYKMGATIDDQTARLLNDYPDFKKDLAKKGVIDLSAEKTLADLWDEYERANVDTLSANAMRNKRNAVLNYLLRYFPPDALAASLTKKDAQDFREWLDAQPRAEATTAGYIRDVKTLFTWAKEAEIVPVNPFDKIKKGSFVNRNRDHYVTIDDLRKMLDACETQRHAQEWRVLFLLYRIQGLRKEEPRLLKWSDIDLERETVVITSPKTANHKGKGTRTARLFPDVLSALIELRDEQRRSGERSPLVLPNIPANQRKTAELILARAGVKQWEKLFQNMRSSAASDIARHFGAFLESKWVGHSPDIAEKHYLQETPADIEAARNWSPLAVPSNDRAVV